MTTRETRVTDELPQAVRRTRRRQAGWVTWIAVALVLVAIGVVGDRVAAKFATDKLRTQLVAEMSNRGVQSSHTEVTLGGFPFLTQVADGRYERINIAISDVQLEASGGRIVTLPRLDVLATGVDANTVDVLRGTAKVVADEVTGMAVVSFATLETLVDYSRFSLSGVRFTAANGGLRVTANANVAGSSVPISGTAQVSAVNGAMAVKLSDARAVGVQAPPPVRDYLSDLVQRTLAAQLPQLPFGLTLDKVTVEPDGLAITAKGQHVPLVS